MNVTLVIAKKYYFEIAQHILKEEALKSLGRKVWYVLNDIPHVVSTDGEWILYFEYWSSETIICHRGFSDESAKAEYLSRTRNGHSHSRNPFTEKV